MVEIVEGDQVPTIPLLEVIGRVAGESFWQYGPTCVNVGVVVGFTVKFNVTKLSQPFAPTKVAVCDPAALKVKPFQE
jgi:hypothetical protein